jgi:hypothetical protein
MKVFKEPEYEDSWQFWAYDNNTDRYHNLQPNRIPSFYQAARTYLSTAELAVFSECVAAFRAAQELSGRFVCASCLHLPNVSQIVPAFWAFNSDCWQRPQLLFFFAYNRHELLRLVLDDLGHLWLNLLV